MHDRPIPPPPLTTDEFETLTALYGSIDAIRQAYQQLQDSPAVTQITYIIAKGHAVFRDGLKLVLSRIDG